MIRSVRGAFALVLTVLLLVPAVPVGAQEPDPAAGGRVVRSALDALEPLESYRFEITRTSSITPGVEMVTRVVRVNEPEFQLHTQMLMDGEVGAEIHVVGSDGMVSNFGGSPRSIKAMGFSPSDAESSEANVETDLLDRLTVEGVLLDLVGPTTVDGVPVLHYAGTTLPASPLSDEARYRWTMEGTVELWVHADEGYLVASTTDIVRAGGFFGSGTRPSRQTERITVTGVGDPANVVTLPAETKPPTIAKGDPTLVPMIRRAYRGAMSDLRSWRSDSRALQMGFFVRERAGGGDNGPQGQGTYRLGRRRVPGVPDPRGTDVGPGSR